eukprot:TRINITY_DN1623_c0_g1_i3.p1 TRINITY_DN1623_c0_g1~~TRINITY_DN1623_c0_g1_i3.p1  ORF type:complete len:110 (-),score=14.48 TRINITY_DN1623_c0_g1_i3:619-948(-)
MVSTWLNVIVSLVGTMMFIQVGEVVVFNLGYPKMLDWHIDLAAFIFAPRQDVVDEFGDYVKHWDVMNTSATRYIATCALYPTQFGHVLRLPERPERPPRHVRDFGVQYV